MVIRCRAAVTLLENEIWIGRMLKSTACTCTMCTSMWKKRSFKYSVKYDLGSQFSYSQGNPEVFIGIEHFTAIWGSCVSRPFWAIFCFTPIYVRIPLRRSESQIPRENLEMVHKTRYSECPLEEWGKFIDSIYAAYIESMNILPRWRDTENILF